MSKNRVPDRCQTTITFKFTECSAAESKIFDHKYLHNDCDMTMDRKFLLRNRLHRNSLSWYSLVNKQKGKSQAMTTVVHTNQMW